MDLGVISLLFQSLSERRNRVPIKLVIAEDIHNVFIRKMTPRPLAPLLTQVNIACEDYYIRISLGNSRGPKFQMQIAEDVQAHRLDANQTILFYRRKMQLKESVNPKRSIKKL